MDLQPSLRWAALAGLALIAAGNWPRGGLPGAHALPPELQLEPEQHATDRAPFTTTVKGVEYTVKPLFTYEIWGMVVSKHDAGVWYEFAHKQWKDHLNVADVCLVFGDNVRTGAYQGLNYSSGEYTCCVDAPTQEKWEAFWPTDLSNNHLLTDQPRLAKSLRRVQLGDQVRIRGFLVEYAHHSGMEFKRGTSTVRTDQGDGACETIWVEEFEVLKPGPPTWKWMGWVGASLLAACGAGWLFLPLRVR
ncbi:MAG: hypothetical protein M9921_01890 [Fimbriimonadaceae bacterium]|nr:hypothetical protein [Chthonomonadaceae bacterium]MCO5295588.1 hypothetical protein [Fimbriimonadaceae bacterium]